MSIDVEFDSRALVAAVESRACDDVLAWYSEDAEVCIVDTDRSVAPRWVVGKQDIRQWLDQLGWSSKAHRVTSVAVGDDGVSWTDHCRTARGSNFVYSSTAELFDGRIGRQTVTVVWEDLRY